MKVKDSSIILQGLQLPMRKVMKIGEEVYKKYGQEYLITSAMDGEHTAGSYHYFGYALDSRVRFFPTPIQRKVTEEMRILLESQYTLILHEGHHLHIQYNA